MDCENAWTNCDEPSTSTAWRRTQQYPSSYYHDAYAPVNTRLSYPNESSSYVNYPQSPYMCNDMSANSRYAFQPYYTCFGHTDDKAPTCFQTCYDVPDCSSDMKGCCGSVGCQHQHMRPRLAKPYKSMTKQRKNRQTNPAKNQTKNNCSSVVGGNLATNPFTHESCGNATNIPHCAMCNQSALGGKDATKFDSRQVLNDNNALPECPTNTCGYQEMGIANPSSNISEPASEMTDVTGSNQESIAKLCDQDQNRFSSTNENSDLDVFSIPKDFLATENHLHSTHGGLIGNLQTEEACNVNFEECTKQIEDCGYITEQSEYTLQTIFGGKDEDGNDVVFILATPEVNQGNGIQFSSGDSEVTAQYTGIKQNTDSTEDIGKPENGTLSNEENHLKDAAMEVNQITDNVKIEIGDVFVSGINDVAYEEIVGKSNANTKKVKNEKHIGSNNGKSIARKKTHVPQVKPKCRNSVNANKLKRKSNFHWNSKDTSFGDLQNMYFRQFMRNFRAKNRKLEEEDDVLQEMLKVVLNEVGGSVMKSVYSTFHELIRIYTKETPKKGKKRSKPLQVKLPKQEK